LLVCDAARLARAQADPTRRGCRDYQRSLKTRQIHGEMWLVDCTGLALRLFQQRRRWNRRMINEDAKIRHTFRAEREAPGRTCRAASLDNLVGALFKQCRHLKPKCLSGLLD
jgi:hypothetical protein